jgi:hypothetical protein
VGPRSRLHDVEKKILTLLGLELRSYILADFEIYYMETIRLYYPCTYVAYTCFVTVVLITVVTRFVFTIATNRASLTCYMAVGYVTDHEQASSLLFSTYCSRSVNINNVLMWICEV